MAAVVGRKQRRGRTACLQIATGGVAAASERNVSAAAESAGLDRTYVYRLIRKHGL